MSETWRGSRCTSSFWVPGSSQTTAAVTICAWKEPATPHGGFECFPKCFDSWLWSLPYVCRVLTVILANLSPMGSVLITEWRPAPRLVAWERGSCSGLTLSVVVLSSLLSLWRLFFHNLQGVFWSGFAVIRLVSYFVVNHHVRLHLRLREVHNFCKHLVSICLFFSLNSLQKARKSYFTVTREWKIKHDLLLFFKARDEESQICDREDWMSCS